MKCHNAIAYRLDAGHRGAAAGKGAQQKPGTHGSGSSGQLRGRHQWNRMAARSKSFEQSKADEPQQAGNECVCRKEKDTARLLHAAQIDDGDEDQDDQAQAKRLALQRRHRGNQCAHSCGDAYGRGEHVIDHERRGGQEPGLVAKVFAGNGVGSAALRIGSDGLPVGEIDDAEQDHNADGDRPYVRGPCHAQRDQKRQGSFGSVCSRTQSIQAEDRNAFQRSDPLGFLFLGGQRTAE